MTIRVSVLDREYVTVCPSLVQLAKVTEFVTVMIVTWWREKQIRQWDKWPNTGK